MNFMSSTTIARTHSARWDAILAPYNLGYRIKLLSQLIGRTFQERLEPFGLTLCHWLVLCCLWEEDGLAISPIAERLTQVGGTLTGVLDRMEERGLVRREQNPRDRRVWHIWLTPAGKQLQEVLLPIARGIRDQAMESLSIPEQERLSQLIERAIANLS